MSELKPCPCGEVPNSVHVETDDSNTRPKWSRVAGSCCGEWSVEFRNGYEEIGSDESERLAREAWNEAKRGGR